LDFETIFTKGSLRFLKFLKVSFCSERLTESTSTANLRSLKIHDKDTDISKLNAEASLALNDRGCVLFHQSLKALQIRREFMTLECEGVRERYEDDEAVYECSTTECTYTFYTKNQSPCRHVLLIREQQCRSLSAVSNCLCFIVVIVNREMCSLILQLCIT
jgi:hypothetical protein